MNLKNLKYMSVGGLINLVSGVSSTIVFVVVFMVALSVLIAGLFFIAKQFQPEDIWKIVYLDSLNIYEGMLGILYSLPYFMGVGVLVMLVIILYKLAEAAYREHGRNGLALIFSLISLVVFAAHFDSSCPSFEALFGELSLKIKALSVPWTGIFSGVFYTFIIGAFLSCLFLGVEASKRASNLIRNKLSRVQPC